MHAESSLSPGVSLVLQLGNHHLKSFLGIFTVLTVLVYYYEHGNIFFFILAILSLQLLVFLSKSKRFFFSLSIIYY